MKNIIKTDLVLTYVPRWPLMVNLASAVICLGLSFVYHNWQFHSKYCCDKLATLDYGGIVVLIGGSTYPISYYVYACEGQFATRDSLLWFTTLCCIFGFCALLNERLASADYAGFRVVMFVTIGLSAFMSLAIIPFLDDPENISYYTYKPWINGGIAYIVGAIIYAYKIPERWFARKFDIVGASH